MDPEAFLDIANKIMKLNMYPYFHLAHCLIMNLYLKEDLGGAGGHLFSRKHPLACYITSMLSIYGGSILCSFLLGEPILSPFKSTYSVLLATAAWYVIFYMPFDFGYTVFKFLPVKLVLAVMKEVIRCHKIHAGVVQANNIYPNSFLIMVIIGTIQGNGSAFLKIFERLMRGVWTPNSIELMNMTFPTKACIVSSIIFVLDKKTDYISAPHAVIYFGICIFLIYFRLSSMLLGIHDPLLPFENLMCALFFGGIWDTLARILTPASKSDQTSKPDTSSGKTESAKKKE